MPAVVFSGLKTCFTKVEVITVPTFESRSIDRKHLTTVAPIFKTAELLIDEAVYQISFKEKHSSPTA